MAKSAMVASDSDEENLLKLNAKQRLYLDNRIQGMSVKMSATAAGYSADTSRVYTDLENHPRIKALLLSATKSAFNEITISRGEVLEGLRDAVNAAESATELVMAWREIGKIIGAYQPEVKVIAHLDITAEKVRNMDDKALLEMSGMETFQLPDVPEEDIIDAEYQELSAEDEDPGEELGSEDPDLSTEDQE